MILLTSKITLPNIDGATQNDVIDNLQHTDIYEKLYLGIYEVDVCTCKRCWLFSTVIFHGKSLKEIIIPGVGIKLYFRISSLTKGMDCTLGIGINDNLVNYKLT